MDINTIINAVQSVPADAWASILVIVGASAFQQKIKNWLELENPKVLVFMTGVFSLAGAVVPAILGWMSAQPSDLAAHSALWFTGMTLAYRYVIQPGGKTLDGWKGDYQRYKDYRTTKAAAVAATTEPSNDYLDALAKEEPVETTTTQVTAAALPTGVAPEFEG